jgi:hypothetical protein
VKALSRETKPAETVEEVVDEDKGSSLLIWALIGVLFLGAFAFVAKKMND